MQHVMSFQPDSHHTSRRNHLHVPGSKRLGFALTLNYTPSLLESLPPEGGNSI